MFLNLNSFHFALKMKEINGIIEIELVDARSYRF